MISQFNRDLREHWENLASSDNIFDSSMGQKNQIPHGLPFYLSAFFCHKKTHFLIVLPRENEARRLADEMGFFLQGLGMGRKRIMCLPATGMSSQVSENEEPAILGDRQSVLNQLANASEPQCIVTTLRAAMEKTPQLQRHKSILIECHPGLEMSPMELCRQLSSYGFSRCSQVEIKGEYCLKGEVLDIFSHTRPVRLTFDDETIETIRALDIYTQRSQTTPLQQASFYPVREHFLTAEEWSKLPRPLARKIAKGRELSGDAHLEMGNENEMGNETEKQNFPDIVVFSTEQWQEWGAEIMEALPWSTFIESLNENYTMAFLYPRRLQSSIQESPLEKKTSHARDLEKNALPFSQIHSCYVFDTLASREKQESAQTNSISAVYDPRVLGIYENDISYHYSDLEEELKKIAAGIQKKSENVFLSSPTSNGMQHLFRLFTQFLPNPSQRQVLTSVQWQNFLQTLDTSEQREASGKQRQKVKAKKSGTLYLVQSTLRKGFYVPTLGVRFLTDLELLGRRAKSRVRVAAKNLAPIRRSTSQGSMNFSFDVRAGDHVVHLVHGIGKFEELKKVKTMSTNTMEDYMIISYADDARLLIPIDQISMVQKYIGGGSTPILDSLGKSSFQKKKEKMQIKIQEFAEKIVKVQAVRRNVPGIVIPSDDEVEQGFGDLFRYVETPDQLRAIAAIKSDLESGECMDRLLCGDVGYGKTEVAMRAAFKVVMNGKQAMVVVPTTILALQHYQTFRKRMRQYPIRIACLTRFQGDKDVKKIKEGLLETKLDILIGTHGAFSEKFKIPNLALLVIDEEQKFGVAQKEKVKEQFPRVHVLSMSATPIPRTLHLSLSQIRDISIMNTPPQNRKPVKTYIIDEKKMDVLTEAVQRELRRRGQIYFLHNSIATLPTRVEWFFATTQVRAEYLILHGRMSRQEIQEKVLLFYQGKASILFATSIIENGIDIPNVNTLIIDDADKFGLAQLYQLRGRVGRSPQQAFTYLMHHSNSLLRKERARQRILAILEEQRLGSGFQIAMRDMEIRGAGNLLGREQSGTVHALGYEMYIRLLNKAIDVVKRDGLEKDVSRNAFQIPCSIHLHTNAFLSDSFIRDVYQRMEFYKRLSATNSEEQLVEIQEELKDRFGKIPPEAEQFILQEKIRLCANEIGIVKITERKISGQPYAILEFGQQINLPVSSLVIFLQKEAARLKMKSARTKEMTYMFFSEPSKEEQLWQLMKKLRNIE